MEKEKLIANAHCLENEFGWFEQVLQARLLTYFSSPGDLSAFLLPEPPDLSIDTCTYAHFLRHYKATVAERLVMLLTLAPYLNPSLLDALFTKNEQYSRGYSEFGGMLGQQHSGFLPTGETALFLLAGNDMGLRVQYMTLFDEGHFFFRHNILTLQGGPPHEPAQSGALVPSQEFLAYFTTANGYYQPKFSAMFPAQRVETLMTWDDLVLEEHTLEELEEIQLWLQHKATLMKDWQLERKIKPGYRALFYGPPGTGKTMTAALIGQVTGREVYRIDLSQVVSKYIGETEKNLANVFDRAEHSDWILFFDEADALFGKRSTTKDAKDRYANQEVAYLLQRIEDFPGVAILATNFKNNVDDAFTRRFQSMIFFPMPNPQLRLILWKKAFSSPLPIAPDIDWANIAHRYELAGGAIINVLRYCALAAVRRQPALVMMDDLLRGIRKELRKEGKSGEG